MADKKSIVDRLRPLLGAQFTESEAEKMRNQKPELDRLRSLLGAQFTESEAEKMRNKKSKSGFSKLKNFIKSK